ncbi:MAG: xylose isomerase, partial [Flavobacteriaceae bacterium]
MILTGEKEFYKEIGAISYEGKKSDNPLAFKYYNPDQKIMGKSMREHFKFAVAYWHSFCGQG